MKKNTQGIVWLPVLIMIAAVVVYSAMAYVALRPNQDEGNINAVANQTIITTFDDCVAAGYPVMESFPRQCVANGRTYVEVIANTNASTVPIASLFEDKVVYGSGLTPDVVPNLQADCQERDGTFNECGSPCATDAEACVEVCAYTCELTSTTSNDWETYTETNEGVSFQYPQNSFTTPEVQAGSYVRVQNYSKEKETRNLNSDEWYIELVITTLDGSEPCGLGYVDSKTYQFGTLEGVRGKFESGGDTGGALYIGCVEQESKRYMLNVTVHEDNAEFANAVLNTFTFFDATTSWQTFTSTAYGYTLRYPNGWVVQETDAKTGVEETGGERVIFWNKANYKELIAEGTEWVPTEDLYQLVVTYNDTGRQALLNEELVTLLASTTVTVDGQEGTKDVFSGPFNDWTTIYVAHNAITYSLQVPALNEAQVALSNQVLATFQFTN